MKRQIYKSLIEWKNNKEHKPLILLGARQVGKTYILKEFGKNSVLAFVPRAFGNPAKCAFLG